jgi:ArsR family transcriptional regulator
MDAYTQLVVTGADREPTGSQRRTELPRWELYKLLAEPVRPRLLALAAMEELAVGELADLLRSAQPNISRHASALRDAGLLTARKQGTWTLLRLTPGVLDDAVVADAVGAGRAACDADGTTARVDAVVHARDAATREFFARGGRPAKSGPPDELGAYLALLAPLLPHRHLAVDAGTGDGALLEVLAPVFDRVIALDRSDAQLGLAAERVKRRGWDNVELVHGELGGGEIERAVSKVRGHGPRGADVVIAARVLHHAPVPQKAMSALVSLARPANDDRGGVVAVLDYEAHDDEALREQESDLWLGFEPAELRRMAHEAGLAEAHVRRLPAAWQGDGPDRHLAWQILWGARGPATEHHRPRGR